MFNFEEAVRKHTQEGQRLRLYAVAQEILDEVKPGETVQEVLINTYTAEPIKDLLQKANDIVENSKKQPPAKKTVYRLIFNSMTGPFPSAEFHVPFNTLAEAVKVVERENEKSLYYFILQQEVDA